ncbi:MAG: isoprenylcysteine carboxylmethyltransferase family protein [Myxococcota bacterium]
MALLLKNLLFTFLVPGTVAGLLPWTIAGDAPPVTGATLALAVLFFALGLSIYAWCVYDFASFGRGTPAPIDAPKRLVVRGLYRYTRNPMYVGVLTVLLGWTVLFLLPRLALYTAFVGTMFHTFVMLYEEPALEREFGEEYVAYKARVSRWLLRR